MPGCEVCPHPWQYKYVGGGPLNYNVLMHQANCVAYKFFSFLLTKNVLPDELKQTIIQTYKQATADKGLWLFRAMLISSLIDKIAIEFTGLLFIYMC